MTPEQALRQEARWFAKAQSGDPRGRVDEETQFRLQHYEPQVHNRRTGQPEYRCPHCWIREGDDGRRPLRPGNGTDQYDVLKCDEPHCVGEFIVPFDS